MTKEAVTRDVTGPRPSRGLVIPTAKAIYDICAKVPSHCKVFLALFFRSSSVHLLSRDIYVPDCQLALHGQDPGYQIWRLPAATNPNLK